MTDTPNFGTKYGRRKPCLRYIGPSLGTASGASVGRGDRTPPFLVPRRVWGRRPVGAAVRFDDRGGGPAPHPALRADTAGLVRRMTCPFRGVYERRLP